MRVSRLVLVLSGVAGVFLCAALGRPPVYPEAPPVAHTGGFGEPTCRQCHFDGALNEPGGALILGGVPVAYAPGRRYLLTVALVRPAMQRSGFQVSARFADGAQAGRQAGAFEPTDDRAGVALDDTSAVEYAHHTEAGTWFAVPDTARWTLAWTAPEAAPGRVVFHLTANAANGDASEFGDFIYAGMWESRGGERQE